MQRNTSSRRFLLATVLGIATAVVAVPLLPSAAQACGSYGASSLQDQAGVAAASEHYRRDQVRFVVLQDAHVEGDRARVRLLLEDDDGHRFVRTMDLTLDDDGFWMVKRAGKVRRLFRTA